MRQAQPTPTQSEARAASKIPAAQWLDLLAAVLGCSSRWLLESGRVDADDLAARGRISDAARLIRSYGWTTPPAGPASPAATHAPTPPPMQRATWQAAHDAYLNHVMTCRTCRVHHPTSMAHCPAGAELRTRYDLETLNNTSQGEAPPETLK